jgi:hypothetical protein
VREPQRARRFRIAAAQTPPYRAGMVVSTRFEPPDVIVAIIRGLITSHDQAELVTAVRASIGRAGAVRVLLILDGFAGWNPGASFDNAASWLEDDEGVSKIAIVGQREWKRGVLMLIAQPVRRLPIEYFETEAAARQWLEPDRPAHATPV